MALYDQPKSTPKEPKKPSVAVAPSTKSTDTTGTAKPTAKLAKRKIRFNDEPIQPAVAENVGETEKVAPNQKKQKKQKIKKQQKKTSDSNK
jgi:hypothetical protein